MQLTDKNLHELWLESFLFPALPTFTLSEWMCLVYPADSDELDLTLLLHMLQELQMKKKSMFYASASFSFTDGI